MAIKRYDLELCDGESGRCRASLQEYHKGDWVLFSDMEFELDKARTKLAELEQALEELGY